MGHFLALSGPAESVAPELSRAVRVSRSLKRIPPTSSSCAGSTAGAAFDRRNGSGSPVCTRPDGTWLLAAGTWRHGGIGGSPGFEELLLDRFLQVGPQVLARELDGPFFVAIGDPSTDSLWALTDLTGVKHAYVRTVRDSAVLAGSSSVLAALAAASFDPIALQELLRNGTTYGDRTLHAEVRKLPPASVLRFQRGRVVECSSYWGFASVTPDCLDGNDAADALFTSLRRVVRTTGEMWPRIAADLTGGYDSRGIFAAARAERIGFECVVAGHPHSADRRVAERIAASSGIPCTFVLPEPPANADAMTTALALSDGESDAVEYAQILSVHDGMARRFDASLNGTGGEAGRGRWWMYAFPHERRRGPLDARPFAATKYGHRANDSILFREPLDFTDHFTRIVEREVAPLSDLPATAQLDAFYLVATRHWYGRVVSSTDQLWPALTPYLFRGPLEAMLGATARVRKRSHLFRLLLARHAPDLARLPLAKGMPPIPFGLRTAHLFAPLAREYALRGIAKTSRLLGGSMRVEPTSGQLPPARLLLRRDPEVLRILRAENMLTAPHLDPEGLERFLLEAASPGFSAEGQWNRLLGLELQLRRIERARREVAAGVEADVTGAIA